MHNTCQNTRLFGYPNLTFWNFHPTWPESDFLLTNLFDTRLFATRSITTKIFYYWLVQRVWLDCLMIHQATFLLFRLFVPSFLWGAFPKKEALNDIVLQPQKFNSFLCFQSSLHFVNVLLILEYVLNNHKLSWNLYMWCSKFWGFFQQLVECLEIFLFIKCR